jgi:hypothetical protein
MNYTEEEQQFLEQIAKSRITGSRLIRLLKSIEHYYADIRNLKGASAEVRIEALKILREALLDKLVVLSGKLEPPDGDEYE